MSQEIFTRIKQKHDLQVVWDTLTDFVPYAGEVIVYDAEVTSNGTVLNHPANRDPYDVARIKIGDGTTPLSQLKFIHEAELITVEEIDVICNSSIVNASTSEVTF